MNYTQKLAIVIPSRLAAVRLPNKPLADICGTPMVVRVAQQAMKAEIGTVFIACGDREILKVIEDHGFHGILTEPSIPSGTDRVHAAIKDKNFEYVVNLQGDLPLIDPNTIRTVALKIMENDIDVCTAASIITDTAEIENTSVVKIALSHKGFGLYFSRNAIPHGAGLYYHHIGIYGYKMKALDRFVSLKPSPLELREKLEQLRILEDGMQIAVSIVNSAPHSVDTQQDLDLVRQLCQKT